MLAPIERSIRTLRPSYLIAILIGLSCLRAGMGWIPNIYLLKRLAENPFANPYEGDSQYLFTTWLSGFIAWLLRARSGAGYTAVHFLFSVLFMFTTVVGLKRSLPQEDWRKSICLFICFPVAWTHVYWVGYDSLTLLLLSLIMFTLRRPSLACVIGIGIGLQHAFQGCVALGCLGAVTAYATTLDKDRRPDLIGAAAAIGGLGLGWILLRLIILMNGIDLHYGRTAWLSDHGAEVLSNNFYTFWIFLYCLCGPGWFAILLYISTHNKNLALVVTLVFAAAVTFITADVTRIFSILTYPAIMYCLLLDKEWIRKLSFRHISQLISIWLLTPWLFDWGGTILTTALFYDLALCLHSVLRWPATMPDWPFLR